MTKVEQFESIRHDRRVEKLSVRHFRVGIEPLGLFPATRSNTQVAITAAQFQNNTTLLLVDVPDFPVEIVAVGDHRGRIIRSTQETGVINPPLGVIETARISATGGPAELAATPDGFAL